MTMHPLDNPIWASLSTQHRAVALQCDGVLRYPSALAPFLGATAPLTENALATLVAPAERVFMIGPRPNVPNGWQVEGLGVLDQMICEAAVPGSGNAAIVPLGEQHRAAVLELTALVYPHYFRERTMELGRYFGIFEEGRLAAMLGERMGMPGFREVSALCTHPDFLGLGFAKQLLVFLSNDNLARGKVPFLHVNPDNVRARELYSRNGYRTRSMVTFWSLRREPRGSAGA